MGNQIILFLSYKLYAGHSLETLGSLQFFLEHSLVSALNNPAQKSGVHICALYNKGGLLYESIIIYQTMLLSLLGGGEGGREEGGGGGGTGTGTGTLG